MLDSAQMAMDCTAPIRGVRRPRQIWLAYGLLAAMVVSYLAYRLLRHSETYSSLMDGWFVVAIEMLGSCLALARGLTHRRRRTVPLVLGCAMLSWSVGDAVLTIESLGGGTPSTPSLADAFYLGFFPLAYMGIALFTRGEVRRLSTPSWLDSVIAALGAGAICAAFAFHSLVLSAGGTALADATNLAYPVGDLLLLAMVFGSAAALAGRSRTPWVLLASGMAINAAGDTANLFGSAGSPAHIGSVLNAVAWPTSILLISAATWADPGHSDPRIIQKPAGFLIPGIAAFGSLMILAFASLLHISMEAVGLAGATLAVVGFRLALSVRGLRTITLERQHQSLTDHLTGLGNRRYLFDILEAFFMDGGDDSMRERRMAFLYIDLDGFKEINDSFGHPAGDELLIDLGKRLSASIRDCDALVRLGGDEFAAVLMDADGEDAVAGAQRLTACLEEPFVLEAVSVRVGASIGIAQAPADAQSADALVACADLAMYRAKVKRESFAIYNSEFDETGNQLRLAEELRSAIELGGLELHYQPLLELQSEEILAVEALLRWRHPRLGMVPPLTFLPLAEQAGLMEALTSWVLGEALSQVALWRAAGSQVVVSVNVSASNLLAPGFTSFVRESIEAHDVPAGALVLEITETSLITEFDRASLVVDELCALGVIVSIDDFGTGFTSLAYLSSLNVGELKLDRSFIESLASGDRDRDLRLVRSTIELGHALDMRVVAEGIEDADTLKLLSELGCDIVQGYFVGKPAPGHSLSFGAGEPGARREASAEGEEPVTRSLRLRAPSRPIPAA